jgi:hypothetical protein
MNIDIKTATDKEILNAHIESVKKVEYGISQEEKKRYLMSNGLFKLVETKQYEINSYRDPKDNKLWKRVPIDISDEDFINLRDFHKTHLRDNIKQPAAKIIGQVIILLGIILAFFLSLIPIVGIYIGLITGLSSILFGILYITLGNILFSLNQIYDAVEKNSNKPTG